MCLFPIRLSISNNEVQVSCGKCIECEKAKADEWSHRVLMECFGKDCCFITLTYDNDHLPTDNSVNKADFQKFIKRLRKYHDIKYFACGEYGDKGGRPHYHAIIIGYCFENDSKEFINNKPCYYSKELRSLWKFGFSTTAEVTFDTIRYCAKYAQKQIFGKKLDPLAVLIDGRSATFEKTFGLKPPFLLMSKGLGYDRFIATADFVSGKIYNQGHYTKIPRYFLDRFEREHDCELTELRKKRLEVATKNRKSYQEIKNHRKYVLKRLTKLKV